MVDGSGGEIAQVLVVDGVELAMLDQVADVGELEDPNAIVLEQDFDAIDEAVGVGDMREHIVADDHVGALAFVAELGGQVLAEEVIERGDADLDGGFGRSFGRDRCPERGRRSPRNS